MTVSTHVYTAVLKGSPDVALSVRGGQLTIDAGNAPHVRGRLEVAMPGTWSTVSGKPEWTPSSSTLAALDPRAGVRIAVTANATTPGGTQTRTFNLGLRVRTFNHAAGTISLDLASDEALLADFAPLADDITPRASETSLRAIVNYVLNKAIPGTSLASVPSNNADMTRYWSVTNLILNPSGNGVTTNWASAGNCTLFAAGVGYTGTSAIGVTASGAGVAGISPFSGLTQAVSVTPGRSYVFSVRGLAYQASPTRAAQCYIRWYDVNGNPIGGDVGGVGATLNTATWARAYVIATAPVGAVKAWMFANVAGFTASGQIVYLDAAMVYEGDELIPEFDGSSTGGGYTYTWQGTAHASASTRTPVIERAKDSLTWQTGQSALDFLAPLVQAAGYRIVCDETRTWTIRPDGYTAVGALSIRHAINLIDGTDTISRDSGLWFDAAVTTYTWTDPISGVQQKRADFYALTGSYTRLQKFEKTTPYPGPGFSQYAVRRAQGRGRELSVTAVSDWTADAEQPITIVLDSPPIQIGGAQQVVFNLDNDEMTITTRTTDTPAGAIDLLTGTIDSLVGTIDSL